MGTLSRIDCSRGNPAHGAAADIPPVDTALHCRATVHRKKTCRNSQAGEERHGNGWRQRRLISRQAEKRHENAD